MDFDAIVIGAGPAGSVAAQLLAAQGHKIGLVEKDAFPRRKVCGEFLSAPSLAVLEACGVSEEFHRQAGPMVRRIGLFCSKTVVTAPAQKDWGRALGREHLDTLLRDAAVQAGASLFQPATVTQLNRHLDGHVCRLEINGDVLEITAPLIIAAAGSWRVKPPFAVESPCRPSDLLAFKAHFTGDALAPGLMPLLAFPGGYGGLVASDGGRVSLSCCVRRETLTAMRRPGERAGEAVLRHILATTRGVELALEGALLSESILSAGPIRPGMRPRFEDGIFFTGNLAGEAHPVIAEGISIAMQGSFLLARLLRQHGGKAGPVYATAWRRQFGPRLAWAALVARAVLSARAPSTALVKAVPALLGWGALLSGKNVQLWQRPVPS
jgi:flavin-dependent dehydrogenase